MLSNTLSNTPISTLTAGDSLEVTFQDSAHPASEWTMKFVLMRNGSLLYQVDATANGDSYNVVVPSVQSSAITPGIVQATLVFDNVADPTIRQTLYIGSLNILPNPLDTLVPTANMLALQSINDTIAFVSASPAQSVNFNGQSYTIHNLDELFKIRDRLQALVDAELRAVGASSRGSFKIIKTRFR